MNLTDFYIRNFTLHLCDVIIPQKCTVMEIFVNETIRKQIPRIQISLFHTGMGRI